ncbi:MAG: hypothetical protein KKF62_08500 [Bacteroidetes bacterium]|nr:hypothetical protein [Bacteroidota bacterium]MBU1114306.1 hypothetical protein [Bacteroidota bacterium]MBU1797084.1 hypothetical protein [Bacteroidota bacterium]
MEFKKVSVEILDNEVSKIKQFLMSLSDIRNSISIKKLEGGNESKSDFYVFTIEQDVLKEFVIKLSNANLKIVTQEEINEKLRSTIKSNAAYNSATDTDISPADLKAAKSVKTIEDFIKEGEYKILLNIIKDIRLEQNKRNRAEGALPAAVKKAIEIHYEEGLQSKRRAFVSLEELVEIATNSQLKTLRLNHILENAGFRAIEICIHYKDFADELIKIANNIKIPNIVSIKAIIKFAEITLNDSRNFKPDFEADIIYAIKNTNLRWLNIAFDSVINTLNEEEKNNVEKFMDFIKYKKLGNK